MVRKAYCDICGEETDILGDEDTIRISYPAGEDDVAVLWLRDVCWNCRAKIVEFIMKLKQERRGKNGRGRC